MAKDVFFLKRQSQGFIENIRVIRTLLNRQSVVQLVGSFLFGLAGFFAEIGLAAALNAILVFIGLVNADKLPSLIRSINLPGGWIVLITCFFLALRAVALFGKQMISGMIYWDFRRSYEQRLAAAAICDATHSPISAAYVSSMVATGIPRAAHVIRGLSEVVLYSVMVIPLFFSLIYLDLKLAAISFVGIGLVAGCSAWMNRYVLESGNTLNSIFKKFTEGYLRSIRNRMLVRIYGITKEETYECIQMSQRFRNKMTSIVMWNSAIPVISNFLAPIWLFVVIWIAVKHLTVEPAVLLSFFYLFLRLGVNLSSLSGSVSAMLADLPGAQELAKAPWISQEIPLPGKQLSRLIDKVPSSGSVPGVQQKDLERNDVAVKGVQIEGANLSAAYSENIIFSGISFSLPSGDCLGIIGPSGCGKSTLISLIAGLMEPADGKIMINNLMPNTDGYSKLRQKFGYIGPEPLIKQGTVYENLIYGLNRSVDVEKCVEILEKVQLPEFSSPGDEGMDRMIYEGGEGLSAGQKQRLCLARALLRHPRLLILDEATANLDQETEKLIIERLRQLKGSMTIIVATHRPQPLTLADQIINLESIGQQIGNH